MVPTSKQIGNSLEKVHNCAAFLSIVVASL
jgi:hypothetical protein